MAHWASNRRTLFIGIGALSAALLTTNVMAQDMSEISGTLNYGGQPIPAGRVEITVEGAAPAAARAGGAPDAAAQVLDSNGKAPSLPFALPAEAAAPEARSAGGPVTVVATLKRESDGWLLARGSKQITPGTPVQIELFDVMY